MLLVALGVTHRAMSPGTPAEAKQQPQAAGASRPVQGETADLCAALRAAFSQSSRDTNATPGTPCLNPARNILFAIATAPNPANSQLALSFDRTIESIQRAAGDRGFLFDRFVFPWDAEPHRQTDTDKKRLEEKRRRESETKPGILLFRGHFDERDPMHRFASLAVLLVPENPSSGINGDAFETAAKFARDNSISDAPLAILGPSFSSSAESLHNAIHRTNLRYMIRSGSATVPEAWALLNHDNHTFAATVRDDDQSTEALFKHLDAAGEWHKQGRVAILAESGTLYGAHASNSQQSSNRLNLVFPRGISWLRNAYQDMPVSATPNWPAGVASPIANLLPFAMGEPTYGDDKPPSLSATQTPVSQEAALLSIANTLRRERVRFAVISSTDPLDNIFLIRFLRTHCPDLRMITFESDLLYVRAATEFPATGVILVTTYPLFLQNQVWTGYGSSEDRVQFVSMGSEGTYNAFRSILMDSAGGVPAGGDRPLDYQVPFEPHTRKPPVWLTVTTPNGYWPLAVLGDDDGKGNHGLQASLGSKLLYSWPYEEHQNQPDEAARLPLIEGVSRLWYSLAFVLIGICILPLLAVQGRVDCSSLPLLCNFAYGPPGDRNAFGRAFFRAVVFLSLAMLCLLLASPTVVLWRNGPGWEALMVAAMLSAMGVGLLVAVAWDVARVRRAPAAGQNPHYWFMFAAAVGLVVFWLESWRQTFYGGLHHEGFFAAYRSLDLVNGVAPTIPFDLIVLALICWAWVHLKRLRMFAETPLAMQAGGQAARLVKQIGQVQDAVQNPFSLPALAYVVALSAVAALYFVMGEYTQSLELRPFDVLYGVAFSVVVLLLVLTCTRMVYIWIRLRSALRTVDLLPVREAFGTVPLIDSWGPILHRAIEPGYADQHTADGALPYVCFIQVTCRQIENLLVFLSVGFVLTLVSLNSYPFQSGHVLGWFMAGLLIAIGVAVGFVLASAERDMVLSRLNGTSPGKIGKDFYMNLLSYGALPVLTVLAAQFPAVGSFLFSWVQPLLQTLRG
jgi:hypothetical protein